MFDIGHFVVTHRETNMVIPVAVLLNSMDFKMNPKLFVCYCVSSSLLYSVHYVHYGFVRICIKSLEKKC
jgi:hypothetical protein